MKKLTLPLLFAGSVLLTAALSAPARADDFASFDTGSFQFVNNGSTGSLTNATSTANFKFLNAVQFGSTSYAAGQSIAATVTLTSATDGAASLSGRNLDQAMQSFNMVFTNSAGQTLLSISNATGDLTGKNGSISANFSSDTSAGDALSYSSNFLTFDNSGVNNDSIALSLQRGTLGKGSDGVLNNFGANAGGQFGTTSGILPAPEMSSAVSFGLMGGAMFLLPALRLKARRQSDAV